ncbi:MAG TPA: LolA-related protein [Steroidobacteraceae bacterium]|nr:LolA-related protein [Steroidobacteraceae bacterium]
MMVRLLQMAGWLLPGLAMAAVPDPDALLRHLARAAPATTAFVEVHFSPLLSRPLIVSGELEYGGPDVLGRTVAKPYSEQTQIRGDTVTIVRGAGKPRTFSLERAPELKILLSSFSALLEGNRRRLETDFTLTVEGDAAHWSLGLTPRDARLRQRVPQITVTGAASGPRCMITTAPDGSLTVMLMEDAARTEVAPDVDRAGLEQACR